MAFPWLSVVMPTYNGARYLGESLGSILSQHDPDLEVIVVDDGSDDETFAILKAFSTRMAITVVEQPHAGNWVASTNRGLSLARGDYVCMLHQDDLWLADRLQVLKPSVRLFPETSLWLTPCWFIDRGGRRIGTWHCPLPKGGSGLNQGDLVGRLLVQNFIGMPSPLFRRSAAERVGGLDEALWYTADWDFWLKLASSGESRYLSRPLAAFRIHPQSQTARRGVREDLRGQLVAVLDRHLTAWASRHPADPSVESKARVSIELNVWLADRAGGGRPSLRPLLRALPTLRPSDWLRFLHETRIGERVASRLVGGIGAAGSGVKSERFKGPDENGNHPGRYF